MLDITDNLSAMKKLFLLLLFCLYPLFSVPAFPSLEPSITTGLFPGTEQNQEMHIKDIQNLTPREIILVALEYSLCPAESEEGQSCLKKYESIEKSARKQFAGLEQMEVAEKVLRFLYDSLLVKYRAGCTRLNETLLTGEYNCVTASILYLALASSLGLEVYGQETQFHAFCTVYIDGTAYDVEATNPYGFNPGVKKVIEKTENSRKFVTIPKKYYADRRQVSANAMATLTGKNIASGLNDSGDYENAIPLAVSRIEFLRQTDDSEQKTALKDLATLVSNYSITLNRSGNYTQALDFIETVNEKYPLSAELQTAYDNSAYNLAATLLNENKDEDARSSFEGRRAKISPSMQSKIDRMITAQVLHRHEVNVHNQITLLFNGGNYTEAKQILEEALKTNPSSTMLKKDLQIVNRALSR